MNIKRLVLAVLAVFVFVFLFDWVFHGVLMQKFYAESPQGLMRPKADIEHQFFHWLVIGQVVQAFFFCLIVATACKGVGAGAGFKLGLLIGLLRGGAAFIEYAVMPMSPTVAALSAVGAVVEVAVAGALAGAIYRPAGAPTATAASAS